MASNNRVRILRVQMALAKAPYLKLSKASIICHGEHNVTDNKVLERYVRILALLPLLLPYRYRAFI